MGKNTNQARTRGTRKSQIHLYCGNICEIHQTLFLSNKMSSCPTAIITRSAALTATSTRNLATTSALVARHRQIGRIKKVFDPSGDEEVPMVNTGMEQNIQAKLEAERSRTKVAGT